MNNRLFTRPDKPLYLSVTRRPRHTQPAQQPIPQQPVLVHASTDCHVTPPSVAARMVEYANLEPGTFASTDISTKIIEIET